MFAYFSPRMFGSKVLLSSCYLVAWHIPEGWWEKAGVHVWVSPPPPFSLTDRLFSSINLCTLCACEQPHAALIWAFFFCYYRKEGVYLKKADCAKWGLWIIAFSSQAYGTNWISGTQDESHRLCRSLLAVLKLARRRVCVGAWRAALLPPFFLFFFTVVLLIIRELSEFELDGGGRGLYTDLPVKPCFISVFADICLVVVSYTETVFGSKHFPFSMKFRDEPKEVMLSLLK